MYVANSVLLMHVSPKLTYVFRRIGSVYAFQFSGDSDASSVIPQVKAPRREFAGPSPKQPKKTPEHLNKSKLGKGNLFTVK